jgi:GNAT superfamily N-acetyltransferase
MRFEAVELALTASGKGATPGPGPDWIERIDTPAYIQLRRLEDGDSMEYLTELLHRAFSRIGAMGIPCSCIDQPPEVTRQRISRGECFVALHGDLIVGTITLYPPDATSDSRHYRNDRVGTLRQLAVDPLFHDRGIGSALLRLAENWALQRGYLWLALDTPEPAEHLIDYYRRQAFRVKETLQFAGRPYRSVVFSKAVADCRTANCRGACLLALH